MAEPNQLAQLKDIHLPTPISWWPLAPGWYLVMALVVLLVVWIVSALYKRARDARPKKQALALLAKYQAHYNKNADTQVSSARVSELLRRVALVYFPRADVASLYGQEWVDFLNRTSKGIDFKPVEKALLEAPFNAAQTMDLHALFKTAQLWIKQRRKPCLN
ncbi:MAG: DUF4381 domain-containing protein [Legionella sp.]|jgi:hypothetical protein